jgi:uncharacterized membrane protein
MAKSKNKKARSEARSPQVEVNPSPNWLLFALAVAGMLVTAYLTYSAWQNELVAGCDLGGGWKLAFFISSVGLLYSLYLTAIALFVLRATCPYCLTSLALMTAIFVVVLFQRPIRLANFSWGPWLGKSLGTGLILIFVLHLHYTGVWGKTSGPEDPWVQGLANHLSETGAKFYGAFWCPHCRDQKELFGSSVHRLPYIECSPGGQGTPQAPACDAAGVKSYPTWIIDGKRYVGTQSLDDLARYSHYNSKGSNP